MSDLPGLLTIAANNTVSIVELNPESLAVLLYALDNIRHHQEWLDYWGEYMSPSDIELIHELVDLAADDIMRPIVTTPVGATMIWHTNAPPTRWLLCTGGAAYVADYPELFALWGYKYGASGDQFGLPDMSDFIPMGVGGLVSLDDTTGEAEHTLTIPEMPAHTHPPLAPSTTFLGNKPSATNTMPASNQIGTAATTGSAGGGLPHNNIPPVFGVNFIVYGGRP